MNLHVDVWGLPKRSYKFQVESPKSGYIADSNLLFDSCEKTERRRVKPEWFLAVTDQSESATSILLSSRRTVKTWSFCEVKYHGVVLVQCWRELVHDTDKGPKIRLGGYRISSRLWHSETWMIWTCSCGPVHLFHGPLPVEGSCSGDTEVSPQEIKHAVYKGRYLMFWTRRRILHSASGAV